MDKSLFNELVEAVSEDFSLEELADTQQMESTLEELTGLIPPESTAVISAARAVKRIRPAPRPFWRYLLNFH